MDGGTEIGSLKVKKSLLAAGTICGALVSSPQCEMGAAVVNGGAEIGRLKVKKSLIAAGTRDDAHVSSPPCQTRGANRLGAELPVVASGVLLM